MLLASGSQDNTVRVWNVTTQELQHTLKSHTNRVLSVAISPDGGTLASGGADGTVRRWDIETGNLRRILDGGRNPVYHLSFSPDGRMLGGTSRDAVRLWNAETGELQLTFAGSSVIRVAFSPTSKAIAGASSQEVRFWDVATGRHQHTLTGHTGNGESLAFSPDGKVLANLRSDRTVQLLDAESGELLRTIHGRYGTVRSVAFSGDSRVLVGASNNKTVNLWDAQTGEHQRTLVGHVDDVNAVAFSLDGRTVASGSEDTTVRLWNANTGDLKSTLHGHMYKVMSVAFSPDGKRLASASFREVRIWDAATGEHQRTITWAAGWVHSIAFSRNGQTLACGSQDGTVKLWNVNTGTLERTLSGQGGGFGVAFSCDGRMLARGGSDKTVRLWDAQSGEQLRTFTGHAEEVTNVAFSPDGRTIASGGWDGTVLLWEVTPVVTAASTVSITPSAVPSPLLGERLTLAISIAAGEDVAGFQATVFFDVGALQYVESASGGYLPGDAFFVPPVVDGNRVTLGAASVAGASRGDGTLATLTFEVVEAKASTLTLFDVVLVDPDEERSYPRIEHGEVIEPEVIPRDATLDVNGDGEVNILDLVQVAANFTKIGENDADVNRDGVVDILDLVLVAGAIGGGAAPSAYPHALSALTAADVESWIAQAQGLKLTDARLQRGIRFLEQLRAALTPKETVLLPNYPNPFNPETWIPYHLAHGAEVNITIFDAKGVTVRELALGRQAAGYYVDRGRAAYWDGRNESVEPVASGVYFYQLRAGEYAASRRMVIVK